jgi:hypothetical protein
MDYRSIGWNGNGNLYNGRVKNSQILRAAPGRWFEIKVTISNRRCVSESLRSIGGDYG